MKTFRFKHFPCVAVLAKYHNDRIAIQLRAPDDGEPIATATVNLPATPMEPDEAAIKNYSENEGIEDVLIKEGILMLGTVKTVQTGYAKVPVYKVNLNYFKTT